MSKINDRDYHSDGANIISKIDDKKKLISNIKKNYKGKAYENFAFYNLCSKIYSEDYTPKNKEYINSNKELIIDEIMIEIIKAGVTPEYNDKKHFQIIQDKLYDSYMKFKNYDNNYNKIIKDYESSSGYDSGDNNARNKSMKKIEFDMVLRNVKGAKVNRYLSQEEIFKYIKSFEINNEEEYNLCFEVTISTGDVLIKKIPQVYKYAIWLNFLYGIFDIINGLAKVNKQGKDNIDDQKAFDELKKFFKSKFKFLDMTKKTIIM